jgi:hypothetical protein
VRQPRCRRCDASTMRPVPERHILRAEARAELIAHRRRHLERAPRRRKVSGREVREGTLSSQRGDHDNDGENAKHTASLCARRLRRRKRDAVEATSMPTVAKSRRPTHFRPPDQPATAVSMIDAHRSRLRRGDLSSLPREGTRLTPTEVRARPPGGVAAA